MPAPPDLQFAIHGAGVLKSAASPHLAFSLGIAAEDSCSIQSIVLSCQIQLDTVSRRYSNEEKTRLVDLYGEKDQWSRTLHSALWTHTSVLVPGFTGSTQVDIPVPCSFDFNVAATKYFAGLQEGDIPLSFYFSGSIFYFNDAGALQASRVPWEKEAAFRMPAKLWRDMMDVYYPNTAWLCLRRDVFDRLYQYKLSHGHVTFDETLEDIIR